LAASVEKEQMALRVELEQRRKKKMEVREVNFHE